MKNLNYKKILFAGPILLLVKTTAVFALEYTPISGNFSQSTGIDIGSATKDLGTFLGQVYNFGIAAAVALTVIMLIWGGIEYMTTEAYSGKSDAKKRMIDALVGLGLALASYLILYTINPCLVDFVGSKGCPVKNILINPPAPAKTTTTNQFQTNASQECPSYAYAGCKPCVDCKNASFVGITCKASNTCEARSDYLDKLQKAFDYAANDGISLRITEAWPPTVFHQSSCHMDGTCVDMNFVDPDTNAPPATYDPVKVREVYDDLVKAGLHPLWEVPDASLCSKYPVANCASYENEYHFHVNL